MKPSDRLLSLDVFRGITIMGMILVNNPGSWGAIYPPLEHAKWHGCTPTDLIFPFFLFIVGVAISYSLTKRKQQGGDMKSLYLNIFRRTVILFALGLILAGFPFGLFLGHEFSWSTIRIPGVLQRIAIVYMISSILFLTTNTKFQYWFTAFILVLYGVLMTLVPVSYTHLRAHETVLDLVCRLLLEKTTKKKKKQTKFFCLKNTKTNTHNNI